MNDTAPAAAGTPVCVVCGGKGEVVIIDEQVGCQVTIPCDHCQPPASVRRPGTADAPRTGHGND
ncbi:MAG TPA: hypothetical protein VM687_01570 [Stenotrophomonas sp.]|nr:hypothetical protein [Stenotrophomonas sp.]